MVVVALEEHIEPTPRERVIVESRVAHAPLADDGVLRGALVRAMERRRDHRILLVRNLRPRRLSHVVVGGEVRPDGDVIPRHEPEPGHVDAHVVVEQAAAVPRRIVRCALDHRAARRDPRHAIGKDALRAIDGPNDVHLGQMSQRLRPIYRRQLLREIERLGFANQVGLRRPRWEHWTDLILFAA